MSLSGNIKKLRLEKNMTQEQLAARLGVSPQAVSKWETSDTYPDGAMLVPLAKELGVTIEDLYKVISEDKSPKTKIRTILEYMMQRSKTITIICSVLALVPYVLFVCFSNLDGKLTIAISTPIIVAVVYVMLYLMFVLFRKNPFASAKALDVYTVIVLVVMAFGYISTLRYFIINFPNGYNTSLSVAAVAFMSVTHTLKRRYK